MPGDLEQHKRYLADVPREFVAAKMKEFHLAPDIVTAIPELICPGRLVVTVDKFRRWIHPLEPVSIEDLKRWIGTPTEVALKQPREGLKEPALHKLPTADRYKLEDLDQPKRMAVLEMAQYLLHAPINAERIKKAPLLGVVNGMIASAKGRLKAFVASDLVVCAGDTVTFTNVGTVYFNNVLVYGNGRIVLGHNTKLHAYQVRHQP